MAIASALAFVCAAAAPASPYRSPPENGPIAFDSRRTSDDDHPYEYEIFRVNPDRSGLERLTAAVGRQSVGPAWSPDGTRIAFSRYSSQRGDDDVYVMNADGTGVRRVTFSDSHDSSPAWSPDGKKIAFSSDRLGFPSSGTNWELFVINADGSGEKRLTTSAATDFDPAWSPDGTKIAFASTRDRRTSNPDTAPAEIYVMNADGSNARRLTVTAEDVTNANLTWAPDGAKIAFATNRDGNFDIYVMNADGGNQTNLTDRVAFDGSPAFSPDGTRIAFASDRAQHDNLDIYPMTADGSQVTRVTSHRANDDGPTWGPKTKAGARSCTLTGTQGADILSGTIGPDVICGLGGDDRLFGRGGEDRLLGGPGNDTLFAKDGRADVVDGGGGKDRAHTDAHDTLRSVEQRF